MLCQHWNSYWQNYDYGVIHGITESLFSCLHLGLLHNSLSHQQTVNSSDSLRWLSSLSSIKVTVANGLQCRVFVLKIVRNTWGCREICRETCHEFENINIFSSNLTYLLQSIHCFSNKALVTPLSARFGLAINKDKEIKDLFWKITFGSVLNSFFAAFLHLNWTLTRFSEVYCQHSWKPWILARFLG